MFLIVSRQFGYPIYAAKVGAGITDLRHEATEYMEPDQAKADKISYDCGYKFEIEAA